VGLVAHPASVTHAFEHATSVLTRAGASLAVLFGPEHGAGGEAQDMESVAASGAPVRLPVRSLYGDSFASLSPRPEWLDGLDAVVVDLQDVGSRYYTFVWTALLMARACAPRGIEVIVCDRPNPLGGVTLEGAPQLEAECSFVGLVPTPVRHGLTWGEIVAWCAARESLAGVTVAPMLGWTREMRYEDTGLPWVLPSPNMPTVDTAVVYPGGCLLEGTNLSEGRGTTRPFEIFGAPWLKGEALAADLHRDGGEGFVARPLTFRPTFQKHARATCEGVQIHVTDRARFSPYRCYLAAIRSARRCEGFAWRTEPYEFVSDRPAIDLLTGDPAVRVALDAGAAIEDLLAIDAERTEAWRAELSGRWRYPG
jgi:uncharacterized protein YbbC (DUF1343 family)